MCHALVHESNDAPEAKWIDLAHGRLEICDDCALNIYFSRRERWDSLFEEIEREQERII